MPDETTVPILVTFSLSGETYAWTEDQPTLLKFAQEHGIAISSGCEYGDCGTCLTELMSGEVEYLHPTGMTPEPGSCLPCSCRPKTSVELSA